MERHYHSQEYLSERAQIALSWMLDMAHSKNMPENVTDGVMWFRDMLLSDHFLAKEFEYCLFSGKNNKCVDRICEKAGIKPDWDSCFSTRQSINLLIANYKESLKSGQSFDKLPVEKEQIKYIGDNIDKLIREIDHRYTTLVHFNQERKASILVHYGTSDQDDKYDKTKSLLLIVNKRTLSVEVLTRDATPLTTTEMPLIDYMKGTKPSQFESLAKLKLRKLLDLLFKGTL